MSEETQKPEEHKEDVAPQQPETTPEATAEEAEATTEETAPEAQEAAVPRPVEILTERPLLLSLETSIGIRSKRILTITRKKIAPNSKQPTRTH